MNNSESSCAFIQAHHSFSSVGRIVKVRDYRVCVLCARNNLRDKRKKTERERDLKKRRTQDRGYFQHKIQIPKAQWYITTKHAFVQVWIEINCHMWQNVLDKKKTSTRQALFCKNCTIVVVVVVFLIPSNIFTIFFCIIKRISFSLFFHLTKRMQRNLPYFLFLYQILLLLVKVREKRHFFYLKIVLKIPLKIQRRKRRR